MPDFTRDEWDDQQPGHREERVGFPGDGKTTCAHCGKTIKVGQRAYLAILGSAHVECVDDWEPSDDPEYWDAVTGEPAYQGNDNTLRWRVVTPSGVKIDVDASGLPFETRADAVTFTGSPHLPKKTFEKLLALAATVAGWSKISADGWTIEPIPRETAADAVRPPSYPCSKCGKYAFPEPGTVCFWCQGLPLARRPGVV
jgi:hypothetical protein